MAYKKPLAIYDNYISNLKSSDSLQTDISGNAESASKLKSPVTITFTGDFLANTTFDGSENITISGSIPKLSDKVNTDDLSNLAFSGKFSDILDKPSTVSGYGITDAYTKTEVDSELSGKLGVSEKATSASVADSVSWDGVSGKPETYPPSAHNHEISQINNLQSVLDGKQPSGNYVTESEFQSSLENKLDVDAKASSSYFSDVANSVSWNVVSDKPTIPTKISQLENDSGYLYSVSWDIIESKPSTVSGYGITDAYTKTETDGKIAAIPEQVNADWNSSSGKSQILNKPTVMSGATASKAGNQGFVPAPAAGDQEKFLKGDGTWGVVSPSRDTRWSPTISVKGNMVYSPGSLSSLTLRDIEISDQESLIYFTTDQWSDFSLSLPTGTKYIGAFSFSPLTQYVISILNGIVVMGEISVKE